MITLLLNLLIVAIVLGVIYWGLHRVWTAFGLPPLILVLLDVLLVIVFVVELVRLFQLVGGLQL